MTPRLRAWLPAGAYMLLIWVLSSISHPFVFDRVPFQDKGVHFIEYGTLAVLLTHAARGSWPHWRTSYTFAAAWSATILWGLSDEIHQAFVPGRVADVRDLLADMIGGLFGVTAYLVFARVRLLRRTSRSATLRSR